MEVMVWCNSYTMNDFFCFGGNLRFDISLNLMVFEIIFSVLWSYIKEYNMFLENSRNFFNNQSGVTLVDVGVFFCVRFF